MCVLFGVVGQTNQLFIMLPTWVSVCLVSVEEDRSPKGPKEIADWHTQCEESICYHQSKQLYKTESMIDPLPSPPRLAARGGRLGASARCGALGFGARWCATFVSCFKAAGDRRCLAGVIRMGWTRKRTQVAHTGEYTNYQPKKRLVTFRGHKTLAVGIPLCWH